METIEMKPVPGHSDYAVTADGNVKRISGPVRNKGYITQYDQKVRGKSSGYYYVTLCSVDYDYGGEVHSSYGIRRISVHRLVALTWIGPPPDGKPWVNHKDGNKHNNHYSNLEWSSISENIKHKFDTGLHVMPVGKDHWRYGKPHSPSTKALMRSAKIGEKHPKFKGWYLFDGVSYPSLSQASLATAQTMRNIRKWSAAGTNGWAFKPK